jgi:voltage-gated potassium channel
MGKLSPAVRFLSAVLLLGLLLVGGTAGYALIEGWSAGESFYMTMITITTTGFAEVRPLSPAGRTYTVVLLAFSVFSVGYAITVLIGFFFEGQMVASLRERRMKRNIQRLKYHFVVCGGGNVGRAVAGEFTRAGARFVVVEKEPRGADPAGDGATLWLQGDATEEETLEKAGIEHARGLVAALPDDEANAFVVLTARQMNPGLYIVAQASNQRSVRTIQKAGADRVICHKEIAGHRMAALILQPSLVDFLDVMTGDGAGPEMRIEQVPVTEGSPMADRSMREAEIGRHTGALIAGIIGADGNTKVNPSSTITISGYKLGVGDVLIALGSEQQLRSLREFAAGASATRSSARGQ